MAMLNEYFFKQNEFNKKVSCNQTVPICCPLKKVKKKLVKNILIKNKTPRKI